MNLFQVHLIMTNHLFQFNFLYFYFTSQKPLEGLMLSWVKRSRFIFIIFSKIISPKRWFPPLFSVVLILILFFFCVSVFPSKVGSQNQVFQKYKQSVDGGIMEKQNSIQNSIERLNSSLSSGTSQNFSISFFEWTFSEY